MTDDRTALDELYQVSVPGRVYTVLHYLYFPTQKAAADIASLLRREGFKTEGRLSADGTDWLLLVRHKVVPTEEIMLAARQMMEGLAAKKDGQYDGWEIEV